MNLPNAITPTASVNPVFANWNAFGVMALKKHKNQSENVLNFTNTLFYIYIKHCFEDGICIKLPTN